MLRGGRRHRRGLLALMVAAMALLPATGALALPPPPPPWMDTTRTPDQRAHLLVAALTLDEKISLMHGIGTETGTGYVGAHTGALPPIPRVHFPGMHFADGPLGVHGPGLLTTELPSGVALAATFDPTVAQAYGAVIGREARAKNNDVVFGPMVNMVRAYEAGRNFETYGEDPFLASRIAVADIRGIQGQGVIATTKHYVAYNQELESNTTVPGTAVDAVIDERTLHEIYMPAFEAAVQLAGTGSVMSAYNKVNGAYNAENCPLLKGTLKTTFGFAGFVVSDYDSTHGSATDVNCGNDVEQPDGTNYGNLQADVAASRVSVAAIDDAVLRVLRAAFTFGVFDRPACPNVDSCFAIDQAAGSRVALQAAEESTVLLKNNAVSGQSLLPIDTTHVHSIALVGPGADKVAKGHGSSEVNPLHEVTPLQGITARAGSQVNVLFSSNRAVQLANAATADMAIVFVGDSAGEGADRQCLYLACPGWTDFQPTADAVVSTTLAANPHTVVVLNSGAPDVLPWADLAPAMVQSWYPGGEQGRAIAAVLFGDYNPGGRLPVSFPRLQTDQPAPTPQQYPGIANEAQYSEGLYIGYRHFDRNNIQPLFAFGYGLSYTSFRYSNLTVSGSGGASTPLTATGLGGPAAQVAFDVTNTGSRTGDDVPQLYIDPPANAAVDEPARQLQGFTRLTLQPGQTAHVTLPVPVRAVSFYDVQTHAWRPLAGCHQVEVGSSERDIRLHANGVTEALQPCPGAPALTVAAAPPTVRAGLPGTTGQPPTRGVAELVSAMAVAAALAIAALAFRRSNPRG